MRTSRQRPGATRSSVGTGFGIGVGFIAALVLIPVVLIAGCGLLLATKTEPSRPARVDAPSRLSPADQRVLTTVAADGRTVTGGDCAFRKTGRVPLVNEPEWLYRCELVLRDRSGQTRTRTVTCYTLPPLTRDNCTSD